MIVWGIDFSNILAEAFEEIVINIACLSVFFIFMKQCVGYRRPIRWMVLVSIIKATEQSIIFPIVSKLTDESMMVQRTHECVMIFFCVFNFLSYGTPLAAVW
ncbi:MAG: hypothetical protein EOM40_02850 [Clostridia bacterium]|nr:hypothetical protein [Clostridia bacterium]NCC42536.1 hypothetical protein [Clostridia bacterium]